MRTLLNPVKTSPLGFIKASIESKWISASSQDSGRKFGLHVYFSKKFLFMLKVNPMVVFDKFELIWFISHNAVLPCASICCVVLCHFDKMILIPMTNLQFANLCTLKLSYAFVQFTMPLMCTCDYQ